MTRIREEEDRNARWSKEVHSTVVCGYRQQQGSREHEADDDTVALAMITQRM